MHNQYIKIILTVFCLFSFASANALTPPPPGKWRCRSYDKQHVMWSAIAGHQAKALKLAFNMCRANSIDKGTCRAVATYCSYGRGISTSQKKETCRVRDNKGHVFTWHGKNACKHAKHECLRWHHKHGLTRSSRSGICSPI